MILKPFILSLIVLATAAGATATSRAPAMPTNSPAMSLPKSNVRAGDPKYAESLPTMKKLLTKRQAEAAK